MPKYRLKKDHYLQYGKPDKEGRRQVEPQYHEQGSVVDWPGKPSLNMEPVAGDKEATERVQERQAEFQERRKKSQAGRSATGWSRQFEQNLTRIITRESDPDALPTADAAAKRGKRAA